MYLVGIKNNNSDLNKHNALVFTIVSTVADKADLFLLSIIIMTDMLTRYTEYDNLPNITMSLLLNNFPIGPIIIIYIKKILWG